MNGNFTIIKNKDITSNLSNGAFRLYVLLESYCYGNTKNTCYPSQITLGKQLSKSVRTIQRYLKELENKGYVAKRRRGSTSSVYTILKKVIQHKIEKSINSAKNAYKKYKKKIDNFSNYEQREYDYKDLEKKLLAWQFE
ncbi:helix-turn-helix domain-containing protein [Clostridium felsineum]|uniref:helix-turn-helix domain-containing protein n=1 Tax=Clostridium felsineum TaxID=36839 RepID=UPI00214D4497|nr:helix-turn-helix domain-containing protein [Clostridium felsineum]MCR3761906.1 helix-turn-helix domain-containing protein [Clostridium felsineum]